MSDDEVDPDASPRERRARIDDALVATGHAYHAAEKALADLDVARAHLRLILLQARTQPNGRMPPGKLDGLEVLAGTARTTLILRDEDA